MQSVVNKATSNQIHPCGLFYKSVDWTLPLVSGLRTACILDPLADLQHFQHSSQRPQNEKSDHPISLKTVRATFQKLGKGLTKREKVAQLSFKEKRISFSLQPQDRMEFIHTQMPRQISLLFSKSTNTHILISVTTLSLIQFELLTLQGHVHKHEIFSHIPFGKIVDALQNLSCNRIYSAQYLEYRTIAIEEFQLGEMEGEIKVELFLKIRWPSAHTVCFPSLDTLFLSALLAPLRALGAFKLLGS